MDCNCNCFGIAASSKRPVKRYNLLVPEIFPKKSPPFAAKLDVSTERKLKKLFEYLEKNLHRGPKISRRLARRVNRDLAAGRWGFVQIAIAAYVYLLEHLRPGDSNLFSRELVCQRVAKATHFYSNALPCTGVQGSAFKDGTGLQPGFQEGSQEFRSSPMVPDHHRETVVGILLNSHSAEMRSLGATLLACFLQQQTTAEYLAHTETYVESLCQNLDNRSASGQPADLHLQVTSLRALQQHIRLCTETALAGCVSHTIVFCLLDILTASKAAGPESVQLTGLSLFLLPRGLFGSAMQLSTGSVQKALPNVGQQEGLPDGNGPPNEAGSELRPGTSAQTELAKETFTGLCLWAQGPAQGKMLIEWILTWMDRNGAWHPRGRPTASPALPYLQQVGSDEQQLYLTFTVLLKHSTAQSLGLADLERLSVAKTACEEGLRLPGVLSSAALVASIKEWAGAIKQPLTELGPEMTDYDFYGVGLHACLKELASGLEDDQHLAETLARILAKEPKSPDPNPGSDALLGCITAACNAFFSLPIPGNESKAVHDLLQELGAHILHSHSLQGIQACQMLLVILSSADTPFWNKITLMALSLMWHKAMQPPSPDNFALVNFVLRDLTLRSPQAQIRGLVAGLLVGLEMVATGRSQEACSSELHQVQLLYLSAAGWQRLAEHVDQVYDGLALPESLVRRATQLVEGGEVSNEQQSGSSLGSIIKDMRAFVESDDRQATLQMLPNDVAPKQQDSSALKPFHPFPISALLPKTRVTDSWPGGARASRPATADQDIGLNQVSDEKRELSSYSPNEKPQPLSVESYAGFVEAVQAQRLRASSQPKESLHQGGVSREAQEALDAIDHLLKASGIRNNEMGSPAIVYEDEDQPPERDAGRLAFAQE